jgi:hypothetical protein
MRLRIENIERISGLGDYRSPYIVSFAFSGPECYVLIMEWEGHRWNVVLYRKPDENMKYRISVQRLGKIRLEITAVNLDEYRSPGIILSIIERLMSGCLKQTV